MLDLTKIAVGTFAQMAGLPVDYALSTVLDRAGVPQGDPLRAGLVFTHGSQRGEGVALLPDPFPPEDYAGPLSSAQDYLTLIKTFDKTSENKASVVKVLDNSAGAPAVAGAARKLAEEAADVAAALSVA